MLPARAKYLVVGAGLHGLSTAYHLGNELAARGAGSGADIVILEKSHPGAGASGIACGVVRNNYFQPAMQELMQACVEVWESDPAAYSYNPVGYMAIGPKAQEADLTAVYERQQKIGYDSTFVTGEGACDAYMKSIFPDWRARGVTAVLHEHKGGFAHNLDSVAGMQAKAESTGAQLITGVEVTGFELASDGSVRAAETNQGRIECDQLIVAPGPWAKHLWAMLELPADDRRAPAERRRGARSADVDVLEPAGGRDLGRPEDVLARGRLDAARRPPRHRRAALHATTASSSPTSCGASTTSRTGMESRAVRRRSPSGPRRPSTPTRTPPTSIPSSPTCGARRSRTR